MPEYPNPKLYTPSPAPPNPPARHTAHAYAELDVTTNFSFLRGASHPDELVYRAAELGYRAIAVTDINSLAGAVRTHEAAKEAGLKLLIGARLTLTDAPDLLVWVTDRAAYARLCRLLTVGKRRAEKGQCELSLEDFLQYTDGMIAAAVLPNPRAPDTTPPPLRIGRAARASPLRVLRDALGDRLSLAAGCVYGPDDVAHLRALHEVGRAFGIPLLATNGVHYHDPARRALQDVLVCVRHGCTIHAAGYRLFPNAERYLKSPEQMHRLFADYPQAIRRGLEIAGRCDFSLGSLRYEYPDEIVPSGKTPIQYLAELAWAGATGHYPGGVPEKVRQQIGHELALIERLKFEAYFLTCYDLVTFARSRGILCQGRGSAANSAVCYCIGVTSVDPAKVDLLFERFVSDARDEPPDIDIDFEHERREEVIQYLYEKYGRERAGMTAEVITYRGRSAIRDVGKAMGLSLDVVDSMAKRLDWWDRGALSDDQIREAGLDPADRTVRLVVNLATQLLGFPRHLSQHVGGMVMTRGPLCEMVPIENASMEDRTVIEWDKDDIEAVGILKVDVLALGMLTAISRAFRFLEARPVPSPLYSGERVRVRGSPPSPGVLEDPAPLTPALSPEYRGEGVSGDPARDPLAMSTGGLRITEPSPLCSIPQDDPAVYSMISDADTVGVFQIESRAQMSMLPRLRPKCFYDLVIEVAIVRPGPIQGDMVHPYLRRRCGEEEVTYPSEAMRDVLRKTLGVPLFQEQAMRLVMVGAGFSGAEADQLRRAMAAWKRTKGLEKFHQRIIDGMLKNGYTREYAEQCYHQIKGFGEYGFPESHSASFALLVYVSAWLKRHHPAAFCAALLNSQPMGFYAPAQLVRDAKEHGVEVRPVDVNASEWDCTLEDGRHEGTRSAGSGQAPARRHGGGGKQSWGVSGPAVRLGFRQVKGMREDQARQIVEARGRHGRFRAVTQLHQLTRTPAAALRRLAEADAFGSLGLSRRQALWQVLKLKDEPLSLFDPPAPSCLRAGACPEPAERVPSCLFSPDDPPVPLPPMPLGQEVMTDYATAGLSLKRHPVALVRAELSRQQVVTAAEVLNTPNGKWVRVAGLVLIRQRPGTASGVVFETLEDETGVTNLILWPRIYDRFRPAARHALLLRADGQVQRQGQVVHVLAKRLHDLSHLLSGYDQRSRDFH